MLVSKKEIEKKQIEEVDNNFLDDEITIYHKNISVDLDEYKSTLIMRGKSLIIQMSK